ncbi:quercetin dioxygenase-like cupin family protein [Bradyrhizobium japonicum]|uniref:cupin domain-containing protein n=1 Tax=Bradyrhizobium japonicum TaxID=375 RepID=UPI00216A6CFA|nr:cupin domain-containing protein [Bradyrhizobium japonicum]MCS3497752.1 quercetin dioxygenase-like cupin family protein [Bradyrhizobium japonicum]MCS3960087.1 quercetin dioxygenase-like cupin family protein [Bradyrhizobium japonicum]MCS4001840.1 quercetin dioxygenase-like cupin family protein [Bradyrhizobium japonicum]
MSKFKLVSTCLVAASVLAAAAAARNNLASSRHPFRLAGNGDAGPSDSRRASVSKILSADVNSAGQPIVFPNKFGHVDVSIFEIPPGVALPAHLHPFPRMGYVLSGTLRVRNLESGNAETYGEGQFVLESVNQWHEGDNPGKTPLRLLVIDLAEKGAKTTILR